MDDFKAIADRMRELNLERDRPFSTPLAPDFHAELNAKLQPKPKPEHGDEVEWCYGY